MFTFSLYRGGISHAVFAKEYDNLNTQTYVRSILQHNNVALVGGEGDGTNRQTVTLGNASGLDRREMFVDAKDLRKVDFKANYTDALSLRGQEKLAKHEPIHAFDATIHVYGNLKYKQDFNLGQFVRISSAQWGVTLMTRITEIDETYDRDGLSLQIVFGRGLPTMKGVF
jgi:hypothetical protein